MNLRKIGKAVALAVLLAAPVAAAEPSGPPLRLGLQAYTFRRYSFAETLDRTEQLGLHYIQGYPKQLLGAGLPGQFDHHMDEPTRRKIRDLLRTHAITLVSYGVVYAQGESEWRQIFLFAQEMGMQNIASEPAPDALPLVDRLARQYGVAVSLHNHPSPTRYANPAVTLAAIVPYGPEIGLCADTGHWLRSGYNPVANLHRAAGHIIAVHLKDLNERGKKNAHDVPWGTGVSDAAGQLAELRQQHFTGVVLIEYEYDTPALMGELAQSIRFFRRAMN